MSQSTSLLALSTLSYAMMAASSFTLHLVLFTIPLCRAFRHGIAMAADPNARATPSSPWFFFDHAAAKSLRGWVKLWLRLLAFGLLISILSIPFGNLRTGYFGLAYPILMAAIGLASLTLAAAVFWAPHSDELWELVLRVEVSALLGYVVLWIITRDTDAIYILIGGGAWWSARRQGAGWFIFEE